MNLNDLYSLSNKENINIIRCDLDTLNGFYYNNNIVLNKNLSPKMESFTLAEELAHHYTGVSPNVPFNNTYRDRLIRSRNEFRAFKWMQTKLIPLDMKKFQNNTLWEIADELNVPPDFLEKSLEYRKENEYEKES